MFALRGNLYHPSIVKELGDLEVLVVEFGDGRRSKLKYDQVVNPSDQKRLREIYVSQITMIHRPSNMYIDRYTLLHHYMLILNLNSLDLGIYHHMTVTLHMTNLQRVA